jgi:hypothetical protein
MQESSGLLKPLALDQEIQMHQGWIHQKMQPLEDENIWSQISGFAVVPAT